MDVWYKWTLICDKCTRNGKVIKAFDHKKGMEFVMLYFYSPGFQRHYSKINKGITLNFMEIFLNSLTTARPEK